MYIYNMTTYSFWSKHIIYELKSEDGDTKLKDKEAAEGGML